MYYVPTEFIAEVAAAREGGPEAEDALEKLEIAPATALRRPSKRSRRLETDASG